jgi:uracil-DNA glycosylase family 4
VRNEQDPAEVDSLERITAEVVDCRKCPRLVAWREQVGRDKRAAFRDEDYWARPIPGFGDPFASLLLVGLAPAAHGGNRTGRIFTGDRSGDWLFGALYRAGYANQPTSVSRDDGLRLIGAYISACVRCAPPANKPTPQERDTCLPYLQRELRQLTNLKVLVCLGKFAYDGLAAVLNLKRRPAFGHGVEAPLPDGRTVLCSFHPSQQNTFTGKLTVPMFDAVFARARQLS